MVRLRHLLASQSWVAVLLIGAVAWLGSVMAASRIDDPIIGPGALVIGSFLVPFAALVALIQYVTGHRLAHDGQSVLVPYRLLLAFAAGGGIGVWLSALIEHVLTGSLLRDAYFPTVAVVEETVKLALVWLLARRLPRYLRHDGMVLGAAVGLGFAAVESLGYAYAHLQEATGPSALWTVAGLQLTRGVLAPVGHALWTALAAGALFANARGGRLRWTGNVVLWWGIAVVLHMGWDVSAGLAAWVTAEVGHVPLTLADFQRGALPDPTQGLRLLDGTLMLVLQAVNIGLGLWLARWQWRQSAVAESGSRQASSAAK